MNLKFPEKESFTSEWIITNRLGGYALGSADLINRRKYHGLLISSSESLLRIHLVSSVEEKIGVDDCFLYLDSNRYGDVTYPDGYSHMVKYRLRPYPAFLYSYSVRRKTILILKEIFMEAQRNITFLRYTNVGKAALDYHFRYKFSLRNHHHVNNPGTFDYISKDSDTITNGKVRGGWVRRIDTGHVAFVYALAGEFLGEPVIYRNILYTDEQARGYDALEDLYAPFLHKGTIEPEESIEIVFSAHSLDEPIKRSMTVIGENIRERFKSYPQPKDHPSRVLVVKNRKEFISSPGFQNAVLSEEEYRSLLELLLDEFQTSRDIVAGFPWFSAWGRDTMIALEAFIMRKEKIDFVYAVLNTYGERIENGLLPNIIGEDGRGTNFDTIDASLWYIIRVYECFMKLSNQRQKRLFDFCAEIVLNYIFNEKFPFYFDRDDFLISIRDGIQSALTWMDAKIGGVPVTPRYGKPIEINGLWYNCIIAMSDMAKKLNKVRIVGTNYRMGTEELESYAQKIGENMGKFLGDGVWYDIIEKDRPVEEIRPNFVIACSLPFDFTDEKGLKIAAEVAREKLLTPFGLRSLSPDSQLFRKDYSGNQQSRDRAYHQGTVWTWLLLPYAHLVRKVTRDREMLKGQLSSSIGQIRQGVMEGWLASVAEVWDGENPGVPKGAPAQAWSVAALYCIEKMIDEVGKINLVT